MFVGVADGQSLKHFSVQGGKLSLLKVAEYFRDRRVEVLKNKYVDEIQYELIHLIRESLNNEANRNNADIEEFSSTLCSISIDKESGEFIGKRYITARFFNSIDV